jgi:pimeloyl-ACP methyl ester carboxylesterase
VRALAFDQRGFGDSDRPGAGFAIDDFADDVVAFLDALSIGNAVLVGHSFGSFVARRAALSRPDRVERLVLIGSAVSPRTPVTREVQEALATLPDPIPEAFAREFQASTAYRPLPAAFFDRIVAESLKLPARLWRTIFDNLLAYEDAAALSRVAAPTLLLWGDRDALFSAGDQQHLAAAIRGARLEIYEETGHCPNWERPERVAADVARFTRGE